MNSHKRNSQQINSSRILLIPLLFILLSMFFTVVQTQKQQETETQANTAKDCTVSSEKLSMTQPEQSLFDQINQYRQQNNVPLLEYSLSLKRASAWMSGDMLTRSTLSLTDSLGRTTNVRFADCGVSFPAITSEIIDSGNANPTDTLTAWKHSPSHVSRLLNRSFTHVGISLATNSAQAAYWNVALTGPDTTPTVLPSLSPSVLPTVKPSVTIIPTVKPSPTVTPKPTVTRVPTQRPTATLIPLPTRLPTPTLTPTPFPTINPRFVQNPDDTQLYLTVKIPGIGPDGNRLPKHRTRRIQATIYDTKNREVKIGTADLQFNGDVFQGNMHMGKLENGIYTVKISGIRTLVNAVDPQFQRISNDRLNIMPKVTLQPGDVSEDNALTLLDYNLALICFQDRKCKADAIEYIDFNDSGAADVVDYNILLQSFFRLRGD